MSATPDDPADARLGPVERFGRNRLFARIRHHLVGYLKQGTGCLTAWEQLTPTKSAAHSA
jgi:hypothetical protein